MAGDIATRYVRIRPDTHGFKEETNRQVEESLKGIRKSVGAAIGGLGVYEILKSTFEAAAKEQSATKSIELAVKNARAEWEVYGSTVREILDRQEHAKGFDLPEQAQAFGRLIQQTKNTKLALQDLSIAMDVSRGRHIGLAQVATALSRLEGGNAQSLSRLGIITTKYTGSQDKLKASIHDVSVALGAQTTSHQKAYDGGLKVTAAQAALLTQSKSQLKQREADLKAQLAQAAASDKQVTTERARAELIRRYGGQADAFAKTAAGQLAILHTSIEQVQEAIGNAFLPLLTRGAKSLSEWAYSLSQSRSFLHGADTAARDLGQAIDAIGTAIHAVEPLISILHTVAEGVGVGPITASVLAWKLLPPVLASVGLQETALSADTVALQGSINSVGAQLETFAAQVAAVGTSEAAVTVDTEGLTASQAALVVEMDATIATTEALFAAIEELAGAQLQLTSSAELAAAAESTFGAVTAGTIGQHEAATAAILAEKAATEEAVVATRAAGVGISGLLGPIALAAGALYYLNEHFKTTDHSAEDFAKTAGKLADAIAKSKSDVGGARISAEQARAQRDAAQIAKDDAATRVRSDQAASTSADQLSTDTKALSDATLALQSANHAYAQSVADLQKREADRKKGIADTKAIVSSLSTQIVDLGTASNRAAAFLASHGKSSWIKDLDSHALDLFLRALDNLAKKNPELESQIRDLEGIAKAAHKIPDRITIGLTINPTLSTADFTAAIAAQIAGATKAAQAALSPSAGGLLGRGGLAPLPVKSGADFARDFQARGGVYPAEVKQVVAKNAKAAAATFTQSFVTHIDAGAIADAISSALQTARSNITSQSDAIASSIGNALDERLRRTTLPLTREITALQKQLDAESSANSAADAATALTDAQTKLNQLRSVYGNGPLTAGQSKEISDATTAVTRAQQAIADNEKNARIKSLQTQIDGQTKAEDLAKTHATRRLADLSDEFARGQISREKYLAGIRGLLAKEQVTFKSAGQLLGSAFADGFRDALRSLSAQTGILTRDQLRGSTLTKPTSVTKAGGDALAALLDQIATSGGRFTLDNADKLPKGLSVPTILSAAKIQRSQEEYQTSTKHQGALGLTYAQETNSHLRTAVALLREGRHVHVTVVDKAAAKKTRNTAKATTQ